MSEKELPPWLKEQLSRLQQLQQNLQAIMMQKQQVEVEVVETDRALEETRVKDNLKEVENKINQMIRASQTAVDANSKPRAP
jgi:chaperonin cofactor prefoldin